jgi:hypothetical protein
MDKKTERADAAISYQNHVSGCTVFLHAQYSDTRPFFIGKFILGIKKAYSCIGYCPLTNYSGITKVNKIIPEKQNYFQKKYPSVF